MAYDLNQDPTIYSDLGDLPQPQGAWYSLTDINQDSAAPGREKATASQQSNDDQPHSSKKQRLDVIGSSTRAEGEFSNVPKSFRKQFVQMEGKNLVLVMERILSHHDLSKGSNKLNIPKHSNEFLTEEEKKSLVFGGSEEKIFTTFLDTKGKVFSVPIQKKRSYFLGYPWGNLATDDENNLVVNDFIQLWAFRSGPENKLCLAIVKKEDEIPPSEVDVLIDNLQSQVDDETPSVFDVIVDYLKSQVEECQKIMNKVESPGLQKTKVKGQKLKLQECEQLLDQWKDITEKFRNSVKDLIKTVP